MAARERLAGIERGMAVVDSMGDRIGTVKDVYFGTGDDEAEAYTGARGGPDSSGMVPDAADSGAIGNDLPDVLRRRLLTHGYIRIDTGFLQGDHYAQADQVVGVSDDGARLNIPKDDLIH